MSNYIRKHKLIKNVYTNIFIDLLYYDDINKLFIYIYI